MGRAMPDLVAMEDDSCQMPSDAIAYIGGSARARSTCENNLLNAFEVADVPKWEKGRVRQAESSVTSWATGPGQCSDNPSAQSWRPTGDSFGAAQTQF